MEILRGPWTCFDATHYGTLIIADVEEAIALEEINKLERDVREIGLSLLVVADWYDEVSLMKSTFFDDNTHSQWFPVTGGCNIPALNRLLGRFGMQMGLQVFTGSVDISPIIKVSATTAQLKVNSFSDRLSIRQHDILLASRWAPLALADWRAITSKWGWLAWPVWYYTGHYGTVRSETSGRK